MTARSVEGSTPLPARAHLVFNPGASTEIKVAHGSTDLAIRSVTVDLKTGADAQKLTARLVDHSGKYWRDITFGSKVKCVIGGTTVFSGVVAPQRRSLIGGSVLLDIEAIGRTHLLYAKALTADKSTYRNQKTAHIAKDLVDAEFAGVIDTTTINVADGVTLTEFEAKEGDNIGQLLEELARQDGFTFEVDTDDKARWFEVSPTSQVTITEADILDLSEATVEDGVIPPRNVVRIKGSSGYVDKTIQENQSATYTLDSTAKRLAQAFKAETSRLSAVDLYADRTTGDNAPGTLTFEVYKNAYNQAGEVTPTETFSSMSGATGTVADLIDENTTTKREVNGPGAGSGTATYTWDFTTAASVRLWRFVLGNDLGVAGGPTSVKLEWSDDNSAWTTLENVTTGSRDQTRFIAETTHRYWRIIVAFNTSGVKELYEFFIFTGKAAISPKTARPATDGTSTVYRVEFSTDVAFTASSDFPTVPGFNSTPRSFTNPKLALTTGDHYWILLKDAGSPSATKCWKPGYYTTSDTYTDGKLMVSTDSGTTWANLNHDLTFRLYWSQDTIDFIKTKAKGKLRASITDSATSIPVDTTDFAGASASLADRTIKIGSEEITYTTNTTVTGGADLAGTVTRGANGTVAAAHTTGDAVVAMSIKTYGDWPFEDANSSVADESTAERLADIILENHKDPTSRLSIPLKTARPELTVRSVVTVQRPLLDIDADYEVAEIRHTLAENDEPRTMLVLGASEYDIARSLVELHKKI